MTDLGYSVSLSSVKRTLERNYLIKKRSPWKRYHPYQERPKAFKPGDLVEIDTIHIGPHKPNRLYIYTMLDVFSRWAWADVCFKINPGHSIRFVQNVLRKISFQLKTLQSDHGQEFSSYLTERIQLRSITHLLLKFITKNRANQIANPKTQLNKNIPGFLSPGTVASHFILFTSITIYFNLLLLQS